MGTMDDYEFTEAVGIATEDPFKEFKLAGVYYTDFRIVCGLNGLFIVIRVIKYFNAVQQFALVMRSLSSAFIELSSMIVIYFFLLFAFVLMFYTSFGVVIPSFGDIMTTFIELFLFMVGSF